MSSICHKDITQASRGLLIPRTNEELRQQTLESLPALPPFVPLLRVHWGSWSVVGRGPPPWQAPPIVTCTVYPCIFLCM